MISIITPWANDTGQALLPDYANAVQFADEIVTINNACAHVTATMLSQFHDQIGGTLFVNETNAGFTAANNQGYAMATGDIIIFLNSDVAADPRWLKAVASDVRDGALYGPSLQQQLVAGRWLPYIEGWCIAATRGTWEKLRVAPDIRNTNYILLGPWDACAYPTPYWEDNDLCFRALQRSISLVQTYWPIQHKGGRTAGPIARHGKSFAENERTFTARVLSALSDEIAPTPTYQKYQQLLATQTDIQHYLPLLYSLAHDNVLELGTRGGVSTAALLAGVEAHGGHVWSVDVDDCSHVAEQGDYWTFYRGSSTDVQTLKSVCNRVSPRGPAGSEFDLVLIDTIHTVEQVSAELELWHRAIAPGGTICVHDPETFPGVRRAVREFCQAKGWPVTFVRPCNGMAVIEVPSP